MKVRVVFDASSHEKGEPALNDVLDKGVKLGPELLQLLLQFRCYPVVMTADIRKAFLEISIRREDRDALSFSWIDRLPGSEHPNPNIVEWRMTRVPLGASSSPFLLAATLHHHLETWKDRYTEISARLQQSFYVDDFVIGASSEKEALELYEAAITVISDSSMEFWKWCSNSSILNDRFFADSVSLQNVGESVSTSKILGLHWDHMADDIILTTQTVSSYISKQPYTKRTVLEPLHGFSIL